MNSSNPTDPIAERLRKAREDRKAEADAAAGERALITDFQQQANKAAPDEVARIEALFASRCDQINAAKDKDDPEYQYDAGNRSVRADRFQVQLDPTVGFNPYVLRMNSGLRSDLHFGPGFEPEYERTNWKMFARMDDDGFYWDCDGERLTSEQLVEAGLDALTENVASGG